MKGKHRSVLPHDLKCLWHELLCTNCSKRNRIIALCDIYLFHRLYLKVLEQPNFDRIDTVYTFMHYEP